MKKIILISSAILVLTAGCNKSSTVSTTSTTSVPTQGSSTTIPQEPAVTTPNNPTPVSQSAVYTSQNLSINVLPGWTAKQSSAAVAPASVNITKGNYILYINPLFQHASGIQGGRFTEVVSGMPSVNLVMAHVEQPSNDFDCAAPAYNDLTVTNTLKLTNLYTNSSKQGTGCVFPSGTQTAWFGAYASGPADTIFGRTSIAGSTADTTINDFAITVAYKTNDVNSLPKRNDPTLNQTLDDVVTMLKTLKLK